MLIQDDDHNVAICDRCLALCNRIAGESKELGKVEYDSWCQPQNGDSK